MGDKVLLNDSLCEKRALGVLMSYSDAFTQSIDYLRPEVFYDSRNRSVYEAISEIVSRGDKPDLISVFEYLAKSGNQQVDAAYLAECTDSVVSSATFVQNCERLADLYRRRQMRLIGYRLMNAGVSEVGATDEIRSETIEALRSLDDSPQTSIKAVGEALADLDGIVQANLSGTRSIGIPTGFGFLDQKGGMQPTDLWIIAAEFSQGKTSLALDFCVNAARCGYPCAFYSTEMMSTQLAARMLSGQSRIPSRVIMQQPMDEGTLRRYDAAIGQVEGLCVYFDDTATMSVERIVSSIRSLVRKKGIKVAFVDYLQVLQTNERNMRLTEEQFFGATARKFKNLAKELQICVVLLSQISRDRNTTEPTLSRVRGSGQIAEAADAVLLIYRPEFYGKRYGGDYSNVSTKGTAQITLAKGRNIGTGDFICGYDAPSTHFYELATIPKRTDEEQASTPYYDDDRPF